MSRPRKKLPRHKRPKASPPRSAIAAEDKGAGKSAAGGSVTFPSDMRRPNPAHPSQGRNAGAGEASAAPVSEDTPESAASDAETERTD